MRDDDLLAHATVFSFPARPAGLDENSNAITVEWRGRGDSWAICWRGRNWTTDDDWEFEPIPSSRDDTYLTRARFTRDDAIALAQHIARNALNRHHAS